MKQNTERGGASLRLVRSVGLGVLSMGVGVLAMDMIGLEALLAAPGTHTHTNTYSRNNDDLNDKDADDQNSYETATIELSIIEENGCYWLGDPPTGPLPDPLDPPTTPDPDDPPTTPNPDDPPTTPNPDDPPTTPNPDDPVNPEPDTNDPDDSGDLGDPPTGPLPDPLETCVGSVGFTLKFKATRSTNDPQFAQIGSNYSLGGQALVRGPSPTSSNADTTSLEASVSIGSVDCTGGSLSGEHEVSQPIPNPVTYTSPGSGESTTVSAVVQLTITYEVTVTICGEVTIVKLELEHNDEFDDALAAYISGLPRPAGLPAGEPWPPTIPPLRDTDMYHQTGSTFEDEPEGGWEEPFRDRTYPEGEGGN